MSAVEIETLYIVWVKNILINIYKSLPYKNLNTKKSPSLRSSLLVKTEAGEAVSPALRGVG